MPATTKDALLSVTLTAFAKLDGTIGPVPAGIALVKDTEDTSIKDVVAHRAHWIALFLGWYADGMAGQTVAFPAEGYKWNELKRYNADLRARQAALDWDAARALLQARHEQLVAFISGKTQAELYAGPMTGANNHWTPGRWAEAAGPSHYRSAAKYIRSRLKALAEAGAGAG